MPSKVVAAGVFTLTADVPLSTCVWVGSSAMFSVCACSPPRSPSVCPPPMWIGVRARRSGSAKVVWPFPPYVVPSSENSAWFWLMGRSWPLHSAQPIGAKMKLMILISPMNGSAIPFPLALRFLSPLHPDVDIRRTWTSTPPLTG